MRPKTPPKTHSGDSDDDDFASFSLFGFDSQSSAHEEKEARESRNFWDLLKRSDTRGAIKVIACDDTLKRGNEAYGMGTTVHIGATGQTTGQWQLDVLATGPSGVTGPTAQRVFLLNYKALSTKWVERSVYENDHDFFMTVELSGCRFTLTEHHVMHVAWDARASSDTGSTPPSTSKRNAAAREAISLPSGTRARSVSITESPSSIFYAQTHTDAYGVLLKGHAFRTVPTLLIGKLKAGTDALAIAREVEDVLSNIATPYAPTRVQLATVKLGELIKGKVDIALVEDRTIEAIKDTFEETCYVHARAALNKKPFGAFVVGVREIGGWHYYVLSDKVWTQILPG